MEDKLNCMEHLMDKHGALCSHLWTKITPNHIEFNSKKTIHAHW